MGNLINKHMMNNFYHGNLLFCGSVFFPTGEIKSAPVVLLADLFGKAKVTGYLGLLPLDNKW
jgi:hypothetical protein